MSEPEIRKVSKAIYNFSQEISIQSRADLSIAVKILKSMKNHRKKIVEFWQDAKEAAKKAYKEICLKEKEMLEICDETEKILKNEILCYKTILERRRCVF